MARICEIATIPVDDIFGYSLLPLEVVNKCRDCIVKALSWSALVAGEDLLDDTASVGALLERPVLGEQSQATKTMRYFVMRPDEYSGYFDVEEDVIDQIIVGEILAGETTASARRAPLRCPLRQMVQLELDF